MQSCSRGGLENAMMSLQGAKTHYARYFCAPKLSDEGNTLPSGNLLLLVQVADV